MVKALIILDKQLDNEDLPELGTYEFLRLPSIGETICIRHEADTAHLEVVGIKHRPIFAGFGFESDRADDPASESTASVLVRMIGIVGWKEDL